MGVRSGVEGRTACLYSHTSFSIGGGHACKILLTLCAHYQPWYSCLQRSTKTTLCNGQAGSGQEKLPCSSGFCHHALILVYISGLFYCNFQATGLAAVPTGPIVEHGLSHTFLQPFFSLWVVFYFEVLREYDLSSGFLFCQSIHTNGNAAIKSYFPERTPGSLNTCIPPNKRWSCCFG